VVHIHYSVLPVKPVQAVGLKVFQDPGPKDFRLPDYHRIGMGRSFFRQDGWVDPSQDHLDSLFPASVGDLVSPIGSLGHYGNGHQISFLEVALEADGADLVIRESHIDIGRGKSR
jgi:hypothetical protein